MAVTHDTTTRNAMVDAALALLNAGGAGTLRLKTAGAAVAATLTLSATAFGAASGGVATANAITSDTNAAGNASPVTNGSLHNNAGTARINFAVAPSGSDFNISTTTIVAGDTVSCSSLTYTGPA